VSEMTVPTSTLLVIHSEHIKIVHSTRLCCIPCRKRFYKHADLDKHRGLKKCAEEHVPESLIEPEWLNPEQEKVLNKRFDAGTSDEDKWRGYYQALFPDDPKGKDVNPYYDFLLYRHRLPPGIATTETYGTPPPRSTGHKRPAPKNVSESTSETRSSPGPSEVDGQHNSLPSLYQSNNSHTTIQTSIYEPSSATPHKSPVKAIQRPDLGIFDGSSPLAFGEDDLPSGVFWLSHELPADWSLEAWSGHL